MNGIVAAIDRVTPWVRVVAVRTPTLPPATHTNCVLMGSEGGGFVAVDPATPYPDEQERLFAAFDACSASGGRLTAVWLTHHHPDHVGAATAVAERYQVPVLAHRETASLLRGKVAVDRLIAAGERLATDESQIPWVRAVYTPGHAPGHLCFLDERTQVVAAGDMIAGVGTIIVDPPEGNMTLYLKSLAILRDLGAERLVPAHGPVIEAVEAKIEEYIAHRLDRERRVLAALQRQVAPARPADLVQDAYPDVAPPLYPLAARSLLAHLEKLVADGKARAVASGTYVAD